MGFGAPKRWSWNSTAPDGPGLQALAEAGQPPWTSRMSLSWRGPGIRSKKKQAPHPKLTDWYNKKSLSIGCTRPLDEGLYSPALVDTLVDGFTFLMPYYDYFSTLWADGRSLDGPDQFLLFFLTYQSPSIPRRGFLIYGHRILWAWRVTWQPRVHRAGQPGDDGCRRCRWTQRAVVVPPPSPCGPMPRRLTRSRMRDSISRIIGVGMMLPHRPAGARLASSLPPPSAAQPPNHRRTGVGACPGHTQSHDVVLHLFPG